MRFIVFGDSKGKNNGINRRVLEGILLKASELNPSPEFIIMCGDTIAGSNKENILAAQYLNLRNLIKSYFPHIPIFPVIGNHEAGHDSDSDINEKTFAQIYSDLYADHFLEGYNKTVYYVDIKDTRLIILNAFHAGMKHQIDNKQLMWFEKNASVNVKNKLVFIHTPAFPTGAHLGSSLDSNPLARDAFWTVALRNKIDIVFSGHEHNYSRRKISINLAPYNKGFISQIITGGGGETLRDKYKSKEGVVAGPIAEHHFLIVDAEAYQTKVTATNLDGKKLDELIINKLALY